MPVSACQCDVGVTPYQFTLRIPLVEDIGNFIIGHTQTVDHNPPCLANCAHHSVLNAIVNHLDVVAGPSSSDLAYAWTTLRVFGSHLSQHWEYEIEGLVVSTWTHRRTSTYIVQHKHIEGMEQTYRRAA